jgi:hypothetical protein
MRSPMRDTRLWERHAYVMAPVRGTPMIWPMRDARLWGTRLWDGFCKKHAYERHAYLHRLRKGGSLRGWRGRGGRVGQGALPSNNRLNLSSKTLLRSWPLVLVCLGQEPWSGTPTQAKKRRTSRKSPVVAVPRTRKKRPKRKARPTARPVKRPYSFKQGSKLWQ